MAATVDAKEWPRKQPEKSISHDIQHEAVGASAAPYCSDVPLSLPESSNAARPHLTCTNKSRAVAGLLPGVDNHEAHTLCL